MEGTEESPENLSRSGLSFGQDLNPGLTKYEGVLTTRFRRSVVPSFFTVTILILS